MPNVLRWSVLRRSFVNGAVVAGLGWAAGSCVLAQPHPLDPAAGKALFERHWIPAPASAAASDGLGPFYNARACATCHPAGGRGSGLQALTLRSADPVYGRQLQPLALAGMEPELRYTLVWVPAVLTLTDGSSSAAERLQIDWQGLRYGSLQSGWSARMAPDLRGLALLETVPDNAILAFADPEDRDGDGISGRPAWIGTGDAQRRPGRFGWKAEVPDLAMQVAQAFSLDLGLGTPLLPASHGDCTMAQGDCLQQVPGTATGPAATELGAELFALVLAYLRALSPPEPLPPLDTEAEALFETVGCAACHRPVLPAADGTVLAAYTDLLLHDLGPGLADTLPTALAASSEWRTAPLWGLSAAQRYLHDGRAATVEQAILWHDGEASGARAAYRALAPAQRQQLLDFLERL